MGVKWVCLDLIHTEANLIKKSIYIGKYMSKNDSYDSYDTRHTSLSR